MDLTVINEVWRPVYGELVQGLRLLTPEWSNLKKLTNFTQLSPRAINWPVDLRFGGGIAATSDGGSLARAVSNSPVEATDTWKHFAGRFEIGYDELDAEGASKFTKQEIEKQVRYQAADKLKAFRRAVAMMFYGHNTGVVFEAGSSVGTDTVSLQNLYGESGLAVPDRIRDYLAAGLDRVTFHDADDSELTSNVLVTDIDESTDTITLESGTDLTADGVVQGDRIVLANQVITGEGSDLDQWMNGMLDLTRATTLHGIDSTNEPDWVAGVDETGYGDVRGTDLYQFFESIEQRSDHPVEWAYTTVPAIADMGGSELDQRRYGADDKTMKLGFKTLNVMGVTVAGRPYVPSGHLFLGSNSALRKLSPDEGSPEPQNVVDSGEKAGSFQQYTDRLGFYKDQIFRAQLTAVARLGLGIVDGVTEA